MHVFRSTGRSIRALGFLLFPDHCTCCKTGLLQAERFLCGSCRSLLHYTDHHLVHRNELHRLFDGRVPIHSAMALWYFDSGGPTRSLMHALKYHAGLTAGWSFGAELGRRLRLETFRPEALCPIPLHPRKHRKRGFNQAGIIARGISETSGISVWNGLRRTRITSTQTKKNAWERQRNVGNAFSLRWPNQPIPKSLWLVDDVVTTGSTLESARLAIPPQAEVGILALACAERK